VPADIRLAMGRHALALPILAPNQRPVEVTRGLKTFWTETCPGLKTQLSRQYPKHEWR